MQRTLVAALVAFVFATPTAITAAGSTAVNGCHLWAASYGNDSNPGSQASPFRTAAKLTASLAAGQWGCLAAGETFTENVVVSISGDAKHPITLTSGPGPRAMLRGSIIIDAPATYFRLFRISIQGQPGQKTPVVEVRADDFAFFKSDLTGGPAMQSNVGACLAINGANRVIIDADAIHNCGRATSLLAPAIQVTRGGATTISNNFIYDNGGDGVGLGPDAQKAVVTRNVIFDNDSGVYLTGDVNTASSGVRITNNVISDSTRFGVHSGYAPGSRVGNKNLVARNCIWKAGQKALAPDPLSAFKATANIFTDPRFSSKQLTIRPGPCSSKQPQHSYDDRKLVAGRAPVIVLPLLPSFTINISATVSGDGVTISKFTIVGVQPGATVTVSCTVGCKKSARTAANRIGVASIAVFRGFFKSGSTIRVQATRAGFVGRYKLIVIGGGRPFTFSPATYAYCVGDLGPSHCELHP
jgi:hypothetical protein